jgi:hypothetical protein
VEAWREQEARNEVGFRAQNEWIEQASQSFASADARDTFVCECGDATCDQPISLTVAEYEHVRSISTHFVVALNHEDPEVERLVSENGRYAVVEKIFGSALRLSRATDPRGVGGRRE